MDATELEHFATAWRQLGDGNAHGGVQLGLDETGGALRRVLGATADVRRALLLHTKVAEVIERPVARRTDEVRARTVLGAELLAPAPHLEQNVLHDLLGDGALADDPFGDAHEWRVPCAEERVERPLVAGAEAGEQVALASVVAARCGSLVRHGLS